METQMKIIAFEELYYISAEDVVEIYGYHIQSARRKLRKIRKDLKKNRRDPIDLEEFANATGLSIEFLQNFKDQKLTINYINYENEII